MGRQYIESFALRLQASSCGWRSLSLQSIDCVRSNRVANPRALIQAGLAIGIAVVVAQLGFYVVWVGGDHFEYRVLSYTIPLLFLLAGTTRVRSDMDERA